VTRRGALAGLTLASALALALAGCYDVEQFAPANQTWRLVPSESAIHFVGIKNNSAGVLGSFTSLEGVIDGAKHRAVVEVQLAGTDTGNAPRDENLRTAFFEVAKFPVARFEIARLPEVDGTLQNVRADVSGVLSMHGASVPLKVPIRASLDSHHRLHVRNAVPIVLSAHDLGMDAQLAALKALCGHESLSGAVPVDVDLVFAPALD
jgi:polyisoprenoid-binding protein YceI